MNWAGGFNPPTGGFNLPTPPNNSQPGCSTIYDMFIEFHTVKELC